MTNYILSIENKWVDLIKNGTKKYEFRSLRYSNLKVGDKIYICETKRTEHMTRIGKGFVYCCYCGTKNLNMKCTSLITGEFIIKNVWINAEQQADIKGNYYYIPFEKYILIKKNNLLIKDIPILNLTDQIGNNAYTLAFEISELKNYIRPKLLSEFNIKKAPQFYYKAKDNVEID